MTVASESLMDKEHRTVLSNHTPVTAGDDPKSYKSPRSSKKEGRKHRTRKYHYFPAFLYSSITKAICPATAACSLQCSTIISRAFLRMPLKSSL